MFDLITSAWYHLNDKIKFRLWNLYFNNLMFNNFHISLITKRFFRSFDRQSEKTVSLGELLLNINKFSNKMVDFSETFTDVASKLFELFWYTSWVLLFFLIVVEWIHPGLFNGSQNWVYLLIFRTRWWIHTQDSTHLGVQWALLTLDWTHLGVQCALHTL